ncbi:MAG: hypothetical protein AAGN35_06190 [Bacteroidota bacterium]
MPPSKEESPASSASAKAAATASGGESNADENAGRTAATTQPAADAASAQPESEMTPEATPEPAEAKASAEPEAELEIVEAEEEELEEFEAGGGDPRRLQLYTPSSMYEWGQMEVKFFQQLYTQTQFFDGDGGTVDQGSRATYYSGIGNILFGLNQRVNFGVDFWVQSVLIDGENTSPFKLFTFPGAPNSRTALTAIGPKIKFQPFRNLNGFTIQSAFLLPVASDPEGRTNGRPFLATENYIWWTQIFYTHNFTEQLQLFGEIDPYWNINRGEGNGFFATPTSVFFSYFPNRKFTLYAMNQFWPTYGDGFFSSYWYQAGLGAKYQVGESFDLEIMYGRFLFGRNAAGPATAINLGVRFVKW